VLAWLSVWSEVQTCIWPNWCHCHSLSLTPVKSTLVLPFWYQLTWVVPDKGPLNMCSSILYASPLILFSSLFLTYLLPYLSFPLRTDPLRFQAGCRKRRLNLALVFLRLFCVYYISFDWWMRAFVVLGLVYFCIKRRNWLDETSLKLRVLCQVGLRNTTQ